MFNLEQSISNWREQMLAAGIKSPVPLDELESHLREAIERQIPSGASEQIAFETASAQMGRAKPIKAEFKKANGFLSWLGENKTARTNRVLALLWLAFCSWAFFSLAASLAVIPSLEKFRPTPDLYLSVLILFVFLRGVIASIRLFGGNMKDARIIKFIAIFGMVTFAVQMAASFKNISVLVILYAAFNATSFWLLHSPKAKETKPESK